MKTLRIHEVISLSIGLLEEHIKLLEKIGFDKNIATLSLIAVKVEYSKLFDIPKKGGRIKRDCNGKPVKTLQSRAGDYLIRVIDLILNSDIDDHTRAQLNDMREYWFAVARSTMTEEREMEVINTWPRYE